MTEEHILLRQGVKKDPVYTLIPIVRTPIINPGDTIEVDLFFTGAGQPVENKLSVYHFHPNLVDRGDPGRLSQIVGWKENGELVSGKEALEDEDFEVDRDLSEYGFVAQMSNAHFVNESSKVDFDYPVKMSETVRDGMAPIRYRLNTASDASSGDYEITFVFTYGEENIGDNLRIDQDRQDIQVHVNTKPEQWEPIPTMAGIAVAVLALCSLLYSTGLFSEIYNFLTSFSLISAKVTFLIQ